MGFPEKYGLYDSDNEHENCGFGFIANIKNEPKHEIVHQALEIVHNLDHRGAIGADPLAGDGAGILIQIPHDFFKEEFLKTDIKLPEIGDYGVGMIFLPPEKNRASSAIKSVEEAIKNNFHQVLIDTAGRLQNKKNLMEEYKKIANVTKKIDPDAPHNVILVLDATSGQNVINQVEEFNKIIPITGLIMTKLDGTAKGGILLALAKKYKLPIIALGLGEKEDDLQLFDAVKFADAFTQIN